MFIHDRYTMRTAVDKIATVVGRSANPNRTVISTNMSSELVRAKAAAAKRNSPANY